MQRCVESTPGAGAWTRFECTRDGIADEEQIGHTREFAPLYNLTVGKRDLGSRSDIRACFNNRTITERNPDAGIRTDLTAFTDGDDFLATT